MIHFAINVISDPVCPFCYLGKKRLDQGIELYRKVYPGGKNDTFSISWSAFYLDPEAPRAGIPLQQRMEQRFGREKVAMIRDGLRKQGLRDGINFSTDSKVGHTRNAHRLIQLGKSKGNDVENLLVMELFRGYFEAGGDITSLNFLTDTASKAGIDKEEARSWLESSNGGEEVDREVEIAYRNGVHGVPQFTLQGKYRIDGAQDPQDFFDTIVAAKEGKSISSFDSGICD